jgi:acetylornithine/succinyldiaminopimelate/putrescine aminotransferase
MSKNQSYFLRDKNAILNTYKRIPLEISHGDGVYLFSKDGKRYLDFFSGLAVNALGYNHPKIVKSINGQLSKYVHLSNYYLNSPQIKLAELLLKHSNMSGVFFTNSGTEAVETALKLHGRTYGALSLIGKKKYKEAFIPLLPNIHQIEFNDILELTNCVNEYTAAIFIEFVQGEGGINFLSKEYVKKIIALKQRFKYSIIADEIQSGLGRTGRPFAFNYFDIEPDIILIAKALGGGLPLGAVLTNENYSKIFSIGDHGSTFGGNPVACAAGSVVVNEIFENKLFEKVFKLGEYFVTEFNILKDRFPEKIVEVRGKGFMIGVKLSFPCESTVESLRNKQVLVNCTNSNVLRILPPLISQKEDIDFFLFNFEEVLKES